MYLHETKCYFLPLDRIIPLSVDCIFTNTSKHFCYLESMYHMPPLTEYNKKYYRLACYSWTTKQLLLYPKEDNEWMKESISHEVFIELTRDSHHSAVKHNRGLLYYDSCSDRVKWVFHPMKKQLFTELIHLNIKPAWAFNRRNEKGQFICRRMKKTRGCRRQRKHTARKECRI